MNATLIQELAKQGPLICALMLAIYYFYNRQNKQEELYAKQAEKVEKLLTSDRIKMLHVIENNTIVMKESTQIMKENTKVMKENIEVLSTLDITKNKN
jgi:hypothetical protein